MMEPGKEASYGKAAKGQGKNRLLDTGKNGLYIFIRFTGGGSQAEKQGWGVR